MNDKFIKAFEYMTTGCTDLYINDTYYCEKGDFYKSNACCFNPNNFYKFDTLKINQEFKKYVSQIKNLILVNPSQYISKIDFANFTNLETLKIEAQDVNVDGLKYLPKEIFKLPKLKKIHSEGERFLQSELSKIKTENPQIEFTGWSLEYDFDYK
ncbi:MAG: hypothetical protein C0448_14615 [Sphingobacteriaceae bacterium]|nr:hypothetical protein [Sphingobacteriaceae bacterium]